MLSNERKCCGCGGGGGGNPAPPPPQPPHSFNMAFSNMQTREETEFVTCQISQEGRRRRRRRGMQKIRQLHFGKTFYANSELFPDYYAHMKETFHPIPRTRCMLALEKGS